MPAEASALSRVDPRSRWSSSMSRSGETPEPGAGGELIENLERLRDTESVRAVVLTGFRVLRRSGPAEGLLPLLPRHRRHQLPPRPPVANRFAIAIVLAAVLHVLWTHTRFGLATRAVAENERSAASHGWSPTTIATVNWGIGADLTALAGVLIVPLTSLLVSALTLLVIPALAVALFGGFLSLLLALVGQPLRRSCDSDRRMISERHGAAAAASAGVRPPGSGPGGCEDSP